MNPHAKRIAGALSGAVLLTSGAYALGSQTGDGSAAAESASGAPAREGGPPPGHRFGARAHVGEADAAEKLGASAKKLRSALEAIREEQGSPAKDPAKDFATGLAGELDIPAAKVEAALDRLREKQEDEFKARHAALVKALAEKLDVSVDRVKKAFPDPPAGGPGRGGPGFSPGGPGAPGFGPGGPGAPGFGPDGPGGPPRP